MESVENYVPGEGSNIKSGKKPCSIEGQERVNKLRGSPTKISVTRKLSEENRKEVSKRLFSGSEEGDDGNISDEEESDTEPDNDNEIGGYFEGEFDEETDDEYDDELDGESSDNEEESSKEKKEVENVFEELVKLYDLDEEIDLEIGGKFLQLLEDNKLLNSGYKVCEFNSGGSSICIVARKNSLRKDDGTDVYIKISNKRNMDDSIESLKIDHLCLNLLKKKLRVSVPETRFKEIDGFGVYVSESVGPNPIGLQLYCQINEVDELKKVLKKDKNKIFLKTLVSLYLLEAQDVTATNIMETKDRELFVIDVNFTELYKKNCNSFSISGGSKRYAEAKNIIGSDIEYMRKKICGSRAKYEECKKEKSLLLDFLAHVSTLNQEGGVNYFRPILSLAILETYNDEDLKTALKEIGKNVKDIDRLNDDQKKIMNCFKEKYKEANQRAKGRKRSV